MLNSMPLKCYNKWMLYIYRIKVQNSKRNSDDPKPFCGDDTSTSISN